MASDLNNELLPYLQNQRPEFSISFRHKIHNGKILEKTLTECSCNNDLTAFRNLDAIIFFVKHYMDSYNNEYLYHCD